MRSEWTAGQCFLGCVSAALVASGCRNTHIAASILYEASLIPDVYLKDESKETPPGMYGNFESIPERAAALVDYFVHGAAAPQFYRAYKGNT